jgi:adenylylsulfate kinase-like enzyme
MIYLLYGQPASGKTTLGKLLAEHLDTPFIIDGDEFRKMFILRATDKYGQDGREENIKNANAVATYLNKSSSPCGNVVMSLVNPYKHLREELRENNKDQVFEVLLTSDRELRKEYHVKDFERGSPTYVINTDRDVEDSWRELRIAIRIMK